MDRIQRAYHFANFAHKGQKRKYTDEDYIVHPINVAVLTLEAENWDHDMFIAALLHDVVEDTSVTIDDIEKEFQEEVARIVWGLTDQSKAEDGNRKKRKEIDRNWNAHGDYKIQTIKLADLIDNSHSIEKHDKNFAKVYMKEKNLLLDVLTKGDRILYKKAQEIVSDYYFRTKVG